MNNNDLQKMANSDGSSVASIRHRFVEELKSIRIMTKASGQVVVSFLCDERGKYTTPLHLEGLATLGHRMMDVRVAMYVDSATRALYRVCRLDRRDGWDDLDYILAASFSGMARKDA